MRLLPLAAALLLLAPTPGRSQAPTQAQAPAGADQEQESDWPRAVEVGGGSLEIYQPQVEKFEGVAVAGRAAVSWSEPDKAPVFGVMWFSAQVAVDRDTRMALVEAVTVSRVRFPNVTPDQERKVAAIVEREVPRWELSVSLESIQASIAVAQAERRSSEGLRSPPPRMYFSDEPAVLLLYAGKPVEQPVQGTELRRVVNTPMFVAHDPSTRRYYLSGGKTWYEAAAATGPFSPVAAASPAVQQFFSENPPPPPPSSGDADEDAAEKAAIESATPPRIVVSTEPAELFVFDGPPRYQPVGDDADLLYAENTQRDVLVHVPTGETYVLASGRWFKARSLDGPWTAVRPDQLPASFARLPPDSPAGNVRTFVSGTEEAQDAVADTQIPQTTAVKRDQSFSVTYDGEPRFKAIEGTPLAFAVNTSASVVQDAGKYWACDQAVWYVAPTPTGPWTVSDRRPPDIDQVPPSAPVYNTKYVYVYQSTPQVVYVGYLPGYLGTYPYYGSVVYGTGFAYPPYVGARVYYPRPATFGFSVTFNPWVGFGVGFGFGSPFYWAGSSWYRRSPYHRPGWWGPVGYRPYPPPYPGGWYRPPPGYRPPYPGWGHRPPPPGYRPPPGGYPGGRPPPPGYRPATRPGSWNGSLYARPENRARNVDRPAPAAARPAPRPTRGPNNVYADRKGNVYRQNPGGSWDRNTAQGWKAQPGPSSAARPSGKPTQSVSRPSAPGVPVVRPTTRPSYPSAPAGLGRDAAARQRGVSAGYRSSPPPSRSAGSSHGGGRGR